MTMLQIWQCHEEQAQSRSVKLYSSLRLSISMLVQITRRLLAAEKVRV